MYLLDTDVTSTVFDERRASPRLRAKLLVTPPEQIAVSIVTVEEMLRGAFDRIRQEQSKHRSPVGAYARLQDLVGYFATFSILPYTEDAERLYRAFPAQIKRIGTNDCRIAATALAHECVLVTANLADFQPMEGLQTEDWTQG